MIDLEPLAVKNQAGCSMFEEFFIIATIISTAEVRVGMTAVTTIVEVAAIIIAAVDFAQLSSDFDFAKVMLATIIVAFLSVHS
jgi:hypothetical protein